MDGDEPDAVPVQVSRRTTLRGRLLRGGLLAAAVAAVVALDTGAVPLPYSTPAPRPPAAAAPGTSDPARATEAFTTRDARIDALLERMTAAVTAKDEAGFLAGVDPADPALVARMRTIYRNLRAIGYTTVEFGWPSRTSYQSQAPRTYTDPAAVLPPLVAAVEVRTRLAGFDPEPAVDVLGWTFAQRGSDWLIVADDDRHSFFSAWAAGQPWMVGPVAVERRKNVVVVGEPARKDRLRRLADRLEASRREVRATWKVPSWNGRVVAYALTDEAFLQHHFDGRQATGETTKEAQFDAKVTLLAAGAWPAQGSAADGAPQVAAARMIVTPFLMDQTDAASDAVLTHELTHVAWAFEGAPNTPSWLVEGVAEYTGYRTGGSSVDGVGALARRGLPRELWTQLRRGTWKPTLVADPAQFYSGTSKRVGAAYTTAWLTSLYIADEYGESALARLYAEAARADAGRTPAQVETQMLRTVLKTDRAKLLRDVEQYAERIRSAFV